MMMIRVQLGSGVDILGYEGGQEFFLPADRCTWRQNYVANDNQYAIFDVMFYPGNAAAVAVAGVGTNTHLGYIGKSGRFVPITD